MDAGVAVAAGALSGVADGGSGVVSVEVRVASGVADSGSGMSVGVAWRTDRVCPMGV